MRTQLRQADPALLTGQPLPIFLQPSKSTLIAEPFRCPHCDRVFTSYIDLLEHHDEEHDANPYPDTGESGDSYDAEQKDVDR